MTEFAQRNFEQPINAGKGATEAPSGLASEAWNWASNHKTEIGTAAVAAALLIATKGRSAAASRGLLNDAGSLEMTELEMNAVNPIAKFTQAGYRHVPLRDTVSEPELLRTIRSTAETGSNPSTIRMLADGKPATNLGDYGKLAKTPPVPKELAQSLLDAQQRALEAEVKAARSVH